ncbi:hypothetical protein HUU53_04655 [Candidatus Micrarchaeota archaeon]|nr:hypothetical protein [Candidatus Micrarchaeota archaeon]
MPLVVCDASSLISLSESCNIGVLAFLKEKLGFNFVIPPSVKDEIISHPLHVKSFSFSAVRLRKALDAGVLTVISSPTLVQETKTIMNESNSLFFSHHKPLKIIHDGEAQCMGLFSSVSAKLFLVDEKTTRMLLEDPFKLESVMRSEHDDLKVEEKKFDFFKKMGSRVKIIRSTELMALAFEKGFFDDYKENKVFALHSALYSLRKSGCSISSLELDQYESIYA